jgi:uncharacterized protein (TIGR02466 family)
MHFEKQDLFPTQIYKFQNPGAAVDHKLWRQAIFALRERDPGRTTSNHLGWQSSIPLQTVPELAGLARFILECLHEVGTDEGWALERWSFVLEGWANVGGRHASHHLHNHANALLSGCYYIDVPRDGGDILFRDPREVAYAFQPPYAQGYKQPLATITPQPGTLLVFPAWLLHAVEENRSDEDRISIGWNATVMPRPMTAVPGERLN